MRRLFVLLVPSLLLQADQFDTVRNSIRTQLIDTQALSIAVAVAKDGRNIWEAGIRLGRSRAPHRSGGARALLDGFDLQAHPPRPD